MGIERHKSRCGVVGLTVNYGRRCTYIEVNAKPLDKGRIKQRVKWVLDQNPGYEEEEEDGDDDDE